MRKLWLAPLLLSALALSACGGDKKDEEESEGGATAAVTAVCDGSAMSETPKLPATFPQIESEKMVYVEQSTAGPTNIGEGYFNGDVEEAHDEWKKELENNGFDVSFDEVEEHDSEVAWKGDGRTGIVAIRDDCGDSEKMYIKITNRPE